jgi:hypothetical protein
MIVSTDHKFIFLHIPKTAGTSIEESLYEYHNIDFSDDPHHEMLSYYDNMSKEEYDSFFKFTVIRNPFNLLYSTWAYYVKQNEFDIDFNDWVKWRYKEHYTKYKHLSDNHPAGESNLRITYYMNRHPQTFWLTDHDGNFIVDHLVCFENLSEDMGEIADKLKLEDFYLPHANKGQTYGSKYLDKYTQESIDIVKEQFKIDLDLFGYSELQDQPEGGLWKGQIKGKSLNDFGYNIPKGVKLNVGQLPYGSNDVIFRYYGDKSREEHLHEFTHRNLNRRLHSLHMDVNSVTDNILLLESRLEEEVLTNEEVRSLMGDILSLREREMVYKRKIYDITKLLKL